jgi:hypothetical protein
VRHIRNGGPCLALSPDSPISKTMSLRDIMDRRMSVRADFGVRHLKSIRSRAKEGGECDIAVSLNGGDYCKRLVLIGS